VKPLSGKEFARLLEKNGWSLQRVEGQPPHLREAGSRVRISVPIHGNRQSKIGLHSYLMKLANIQPGS
jgi:predicted RNA binding protein YcfA (HicA-like mRNA interferase family)